MTPSRRRAAGLVLLAVVLAVTCGLLGRWQWNRHVTRDAEIAVIVRGYDADPVPIENLLATPAATLVGSDVWRPVHVVGHYEPGATALLRNRPIDSQPGFHVLVPFVVTGDGGANPPDHPAVLVVDRGWVPTGASQDRPDVVPAPPGGTLEITVRLRADEPASSRDAPARQVQAISVDQVLAAGGMSASSVDPYGAYGVLASEGSVVPQDIGVLPKPDIDPGSHLSYALQWWTFALGSLIGFSVLARRELADAGGVPAPGPRRRRVPSDQDVEDALIDSQLG